MTDKETEVIQGLVEITDIATDRILELQLHLSIMREKMKRMDAEIRDLQERPMKVLCLQI